MCFSKPLYLTAEACTNLKDPTPPGDSKEVKLYAHALKGSAANTGVRQLSELAYRLERMASQEDLSQAEELLQKIKAEFAKLESFVSNPDWIEIAKNQQNNKQQDGDKQK